MGDYNLYMHITPAGKIYVGITKQDPEKRWRRGEGYKRNTYFYRAIKKYGWDNIKHMRILDGLEEDEAYAQEEELVRIFDLTNPENGYNLQPGGRHYKMLESTKAKISKNKRPMTGENNPFYGKKHTDEVLELIRKRVEQYTLDGEFVRAYDSMRMACQEVGVDPSELTKACKGKRRTCGGFQWKYEGDCRLIGPYRRTAHNARKVRRIALDGSGSMVFDSLLEAGKCYGVNADKTIGDCCRGELMTAYGYRWEYD